MPEYFAIGHTVGMVFAKACYGNFLVMHQGCTVGRNGNDRPTLEEGVILYPNSSVIGRCLVRANTVIAPGVQLVNQDTPGNCYVFMGEKGRPVFKEIDEFFAGRYFDRSVTGSANNK
jgi:serine O-acetyltransferase